MNDITDIVSAVASIILIGEVIFLFYLTRRGKRLEALMNAGVNEADELVGILRTERDKASGWVRNAVPVLVKIASDETTPIHIKIGILKVLSAMPGTLFLNDADFPASGTIKTAQPTKG